MQRTVVINAAPGRVWSVLVDVEHWPDWTPTVHRVVPETPFPLGLHGRAKLDVRGRPPGETWRVIRFDPGRSFAWELRAAPGLRVVGDHVVEPAPEGSRVTLSIETRGFVGALVGPFVARRSTDNVETEARALKQYCEQVPETPPLLTIIS